MPSQLPLIPPDAYQAFFNELKTRIRTTQLKAAIAVNKELILMYWHIGQTILQRQEKEGWGGKVVAQLAKDLKREFPDMKGFSRTNLLYMRSFAKAWPEESFVQQLAGQIPWFHNCVLLDKVKDPDARKWYIQKAVEHGWSRSILTMQVETGLYDRQGSAVTNFEQTLPKAQSDLTKQILKDPYSFEFLSLAEDSVERDLERALVLHIREFLLELGVGFAFVGSQYRLEVEGDEFFIDLLFYHLKLRRYVVIDLKTTDFKPEYAGKMNFYVSAVNNLLCEEWDQPTIGMVLCRSKKKTVVEFALDEVNKPIGVSTYRLRDDLPPELRDSLPTAEQLEVELEAAAQEVEAQSELE